MAVTLRFDDMTNDAFATFKELQKQSWGLFAPLEVVTTICAASLVKFAGIKANNSVLDVGCGTGVVAITAARIGANVSAMDLSPVLVERAQKNASIANVDIDIKAGDVESLAYPDQSFDAVLSQFGHMFAPRPKVAISEMLRVLKPGGVIAFSSWPPDLYVGKLFNLVAKFSPPPEGVSAPSLWGDPHFVRQQLGDAVLDLVFDQDMMRFPALSMGHYRDSVETTLGPVLKLVQESNSHPERLKQFRAELEALVLPYYADNYVHQHYLMSRAIKR